MRVALMQLRLSAKILLSIASILIGSEQVLVKSGKNLFRNTSMITLETLTSLMATGLTQTKLKTNFVMVHAIHSRNQKTLFNGNYRTFQLKTT